ncbi:MAG: dethiobiotin synthase [Syntrophales bacterium]
MEPSNKRIQNLFIVGTDTGVGKTVLALLLMQFFIAKGCNPFYLKPMQTGCKDANDADSDAKFIYRHVESLHGKQPAESVIYCFKNPKAPLYAARDEGKLIDLSKIERIVSRKATAHFPVILEGAGGVLVPVVGEKLMVDVITLVNGTPLIAARAGLGTINHTLLTIEAIEKRGLKPMGIVFIDAGEKETPAEMIRENTSAIEEASGIKVAGVISRIDDFSRPPRDCYKTLAKILG